MRKLLGRHISKHRFILASVLLRLSAGIQLVEGQRKLLFGERGDVGDRLCGACYQAVGRVLRLVDGVIFVLMDVLRLHLRVIPPVVIRTRLVCPRVVQRRAQRVLRNVAFLRSATTA